MADLRVKNLSKSFGTASILHDISFEAEAGTLVAILGPSGSGKTTLLRLIAGFETPDHGEISLGGITLAGPGIMLAPQRRGIGYVAQEGALFPHLNVADNITFGLPRRERSARHRVTELLAMVDLPADYANRPPQSLSGGEQQRVALARALAPSPKLLLLDEPFSALDAGLRAETRAAAAAAIRAAGATAVLVTHDQDEALSMATQIGVLQSGCLAQFSPPDLLYRQPASAALAHFVGDAVLLDGNAGHDTVYCGLGALAPAHQEIQGPVQVMIRPEQIKIETTPALGGVPATVTGVTFYGHDAVVELALQNTQNAAPAETVKARMFSQSLPQIGAAVWLRVAGPVTTYPSSKRTTELK